MKHFALTDWADFVREVSPADKRASMQKHLDEGCEHCKKTVEVWGVVADFAKQEVTYSPPPEILRVCESYISPFTTYRGAKGFQLARLTFDSFEQQLIAGIRGSDASPRQLMYQCGDVFIDMRVEPKPSDQLVLAGQIVQSGQTAGGVAAAPVSVLSGDKTVCSTTTNELGEFHLSFQSPGYLQILFTLETSKFLVLLPNL